MEREPTKDTWKNFTGPAGLRGIGDLECVGILKRAERVEFMVAPLGKYKYVKSLN